MLAGLILTLSVCWPRPTPPQPQSPCWYWTGLGPMPAAPPGRFWACMEMDLIYRLYPR